MSHNSVRPNPEKVRVIDEWVTFTSVTEVRSFLGLLNYYRRFINNYTDLANPLLQLTKKDAPFVWQRLFEKLKAALMSAPVLRMPDFSLPMHVWPDASQFAIGGFLTQDDGEGHRPVEFLSKKLSETESKYPTIEREMYAMVH